MLRRHHWPKLNLNRYQLYNRRYREAFVQRELHIRNTSTWLCVISIPDGLCGVFKMNECLYGLVGGTQSQKVWWRVGCCLNGSGEKAWWDKWGGPIGGGRPSGIDELVRLLGDTVSDTIDALCGHNEGDSTVTQYFLTFRLNWSHTVRGTFESNDSTWNKWITFGSRCLKTVLPPFAPA